MYLVTEKTSGCQYALKELRNRNEEKKSRFISEIQIAKENSDVIPGIIPVIADDCEKLLVYYANCSACNGVY